MDTWGGRKGDIIHTEIIEGSYPGGKANIVYQGENIRGAEIAEREEGLG